MHLTKDKVRVISALLFCFLLGYMSYKNIILLKDPVISFICGKTDFKETIKIIATNYVSNKLEHRNDFINLNGFFVRMAGRRMHNGVLLLNSNTLNHDKIKKSNDLEYGLEKTIKLADFSRKLNIPFIYIVAPYKIPISKADTPKGIENFANEDTDIFLRGLSDAGVDLLDLRPLLSSNAEQVNKYFYRTDHHWNPDGAFVGFQNIMTRIEMMQLKERKFNNIYTNINFWERHEKKSWFLGSHGKRVGSLFAGTDSLIYYTPRFATKMSFALPYHNKFFKGDFFTACLRKQYIQKKDYFNYNAYCVYIGGDYPLVHHRNISAPNKMRVLVLKDSFVLPLQAFMSTMFTEVDVLDPRHYKSATIAEYILWTRPNIVLMVRNAGTTGDNNFGFSNFIAEEKNLYQEKQVLLRDYNVSLTSSIANYKNIRIPISLQAGKVYSFSVKDIIVTRGITDGVGIVLYDYKKKKIIQQEIFDVEFSNKGKEDCTWIFKVPEEESGYLLLVYAGLPGRTKNIGIEYKGIKVSLLK